MVVFSLRMATQISQERTTEAVSNAIKEVGPEVNTVKTE
jgi:hypothetical protein